MTRTPRLPLVFLALAVTTSAAPSAPRAYQFSGTFDDGGTFSGTFTLDGGTVTSANAVTSVHGILGTTYTGATIFGNNASIPNDFELVFRNGTQAFGFFLAGTPATFPAGGAPIELSPSLCNNCSAASAESNAPPPSSRLVTGGSVTPFSASVPAISTFGLGLMALLLIVLASRARLLARAEAR
jgi:hypothetical protein